LLSCGALTCTPVFAFQLVSGPHSLSFCALTLSLLPRPLAGGCRSLAFFPYPDLLLSLYSPGGEFPQSAVFFNFLTFPSVYTLQLVRAPGSLYFCVLTCSCLCTLKFVSAPFSLHSSGVPHQSLSLRSSERRCPITSFQGTDFFSPLCSPECKCPSLLLFYWPDLSLSVLIRW